MIRNFLTILLISVTALGWSQTPQQKKLEQQKAKIQKEIKEFQSLLSSESKKEKSVLGQIQEKNAKIKLTESLITTTNKQAKLLTNDIYTNQMKANKLGRELDVLKEDYANTLIKSYKSRSEQSRVMFILSSDSFLQAYKRMQYMKQYASFRKIQGDEIKYKLADLDAVNQKLNVQKKEKEKIVAETEKEKENLDKDKREKEKLVKTIQKDKKKYAADIKKREKEAKEIDRKIDKLIRDAIVAANKKTAKEEGRSTANVSSTKLELTKEGKIVSDNFKANKGKLPWPVEKGYVSLPYGDNPSPIQRSLIVHNSGVEITTEKGASARAIFAGEVSAIQVIGGRLAVTIRHGDFMSVYFNLESVSVKVGQDVSVKQAIGRIRSNPLTGETILKLVISQNTKQLNPQQWLVK